MIDDETKKTASALVNIITEKFVKPEQLEPRKIDKTYETEIDGLGQNNEKKYIGRFFNVTDKSIDLTIWAGYDPNPDYGFNISFSFKKGSNNEQILKNVLQMYDPKIGDRELDDKKGDFWFVVNLNLNVTINNTGIIQIGGEKNTQKNCNNGNTDSSGNSKSNLMDIAISIISSVLKAFGL